MILEIVKGRAKIFARSNPDRSPLYDVRNHALRGSGENRRNAERCFRGRYIVEPSMARLRQGFGVAAFAAGLPSRSWLQPAKAGGARRDRTDDLMLAKHALSQLSYGPVTRRRMLVSAPCHARLRPEGYGAAAFLWGGLPSRSAGGAKAGGPGKT
jgi:hypothetical protein